MSALVTFFQILVAVYRLATALCNACVVLLQVMRSVIREAKEEATEVIALLDDGVPMMDVITPTSLLLDTATTLQMLIIARPSSFTLLVRLSKHRVLHLEVDEMFIAAKLEVIQTELMVHIQHLPRLLHAPIGTHDTQLVRYTPIKLPYVWKEDQSGPRCGGEAVELSIVSAASAPEVTAGSEGRSRRKKYVQLLTESVLRRRLHMARLGRAGLEATPKSGTGVAKTLAENVVKRKALANATNVGSVHPETNTNADKTRGLDTNVADTPKQVWMERNIHTALSENLSIPNMSRMRKSLDAGSQSVRRKRGNIGFYAPGLPGEFSFLPARGQGRD